MRKTQAFSEKTQENCQQTQGFANSTGFLLPKDVQKISLPSVRVSEMYFRFQLTNVWISEDLNEVRDALLENKVKAPARAGAIAPVDVVIPAQNTGLGPEKTSFFQVINQLLFWNFATRRLLSPSA